MGKYSSKRNIFETVTINNVKVKNLPSSANLIKDIEYQGARINIYNSKILIYSTISDIVSMAYIFWTSL